MRTRLLAVRGLLLVGVLALASASWAIPVFARKYAYNCTMCHAAFPRLNDFGQRYRENGYQLPGREGDELTVLQSPPPFAARVNVGYTADHASNTPGFQNVNQFQVTGVDLLSGGLLKRDIGYIFGYAPRIQGTRGVVDQPGTVDLANVVFSHLLGGRRSWSNLRVGRLEGAYLPFSVQRQLSFSPREIYEFTFPGGPRYGDTQTGLEFTTYAMNGRWEGAAGVVNGSETNAPNDGPSDVYLRLAKVFGRGLGQTTGQRLGVTAYSGRARPAGIVLPGGPQRGFTRYGLDASLNSGRWNLALQYLIAHDQAALWGGTTGHVNYQGGFAELRYFPITRLAAFARFDAVNAPTDTPVSTLTGGDIRRWTLGTRYYFTDNLALHLEYSSRAQELVAPATGDAKEGFFTVRLDYAF